MSTGRAPCDEGVVRGARRSTVDPETARRTGAWVLAATVLGSSMAFIDGTVVNVALPVLQRELDADVAAVQWVVEAYALFLAALILVGGALGDRYGRRKVFAAGVALFTAASVACGLAPTIDLLIAARAGQGIGAALMVPGSLAMLSAAYPPERRGWAIGTWSALTAVAGGAGPVVGGALVETLSWRWAFLINLPLGLLVLGITLTRVPESRDPDARRLDPAGVVLATAGLGALTWGLVESSRLGFGNRTILVSIAVGAALLAAFVAVEAKVRAPMLPPSLFRSRTFTGANVLTLLLYAALNAVMFLVPFNLIQVQGYGATAAGAAFVPFTVLMFALSGRAGALTDRIGPRIPLTVGPLLAAAGTAMFALPGVGGSYWTTFFPAVVVTGLGMTLSVAPLTATVMAAVSPDHAGLASGVNNAVARTAGVLAVALASVLLATRFSPALESRLDAVPLPADAREAVLAQRDRLAAIEVPSTVSPEIRPGVEAVVDGAFVSAFRAVMLVSAALAAAGGVAAFLLIDPKPAPHRSRP